MLPCHDPDVVAAGRDGQLVPQRGDDARWKDAHGRRDGADEILQSLRQLCRVFSRLDGADAVDCEPVPVGKGGLIAGVEVAHIAQQPCEGDQVIQAVACKRTRRLCGCGGCIAHGLKRYVVEPGWGCP